MASCFVFRYHVYDYLPKLGWSMIVHKGQNEIDVNVGIDVEINENWFVSGVWDGDFERADFANAEFFCGTGVKIEKDKIRVYSPTHERQRICWIDSNNSFVFSNSIPLLLATAGEQIDKNCDQYEKILCSILYGTKEYTKNIPLANRKNMQQVFCADIIVDDEYQIFTVPKSIHRDFVDFTDYYNSLKKVCLKIKNNGCDEKRAKKYALAATASSGYDSAACAAVLHSVGCETLMTFKGGYYDEDSAVTMAKQIGYKNIIKRNYEDFKSKPGLIDAVFNVCGDIGVYLQFCAFEEDFACKIVSIGTSGSYIWDKEGDVNPESKRSGYDFYTANLSFSEHALINGYIILPMPLYASTAVCSIQKISNMPEMEPWTLHTDYDRPICRRILETAGVDRAIFGHKKYGAGFSLSKNFTLKQIKSKMSCEGYESFVRWLRIKENNHWSIGRLGRFVQYHSANIPVYASYLLSQFHIKNKWGKGSISYPNPGLPSKLIVWGMETMTDKYLQAMSKELEKVNE